MDPDLRVVYKILITIVRTKDTITYLFPISTIVVSESDKMPGPGYWGIPGAPPYKDWNAWNAVRDLVYAAIWPSDLP